MLFDIGFGELLVLGVIGLIVIGPERLPEYAAKAAKFFRGLRGQITEAKASVQEVIDIDPEIVRDLQDLNPKRILQDLPDSQRSRPAKSIPLDPDTT
ncbi:MAG: hypothetical protein RL038_591 [Actinomycetota bacterium]